MEVAGSESEVHREVIPKVYTIALIHKGHPYLLTIKKKILFLLVSWH
jgi:hypothetical protein